MAIRRGSVVEVELAPPADGEGGQIKERPAVVIVIDDDENSCTVVAVSTKLQIGDANYFVEMPFSNNRNKASGNSKSGLHEKCVAKCYWYDESPYCELQQNWIRVNKKIDGDYRFGSPARTYC